MRYRIVADDTDEEPTPGDPQGPLYAALALALLVAALLTALHALGLL